MKGIAGRSLALVLALAALTACSNRPSGSNSTVPSAQAQSSATTAQSRPDSTTAARPSTQEPSLGVLSNGGEFFLLISPPPDKWPSNELFTIDVRILNGSDRKSVAGDVSLNVDAAMPAHHHGMNTKPKVSRNPDGSFTARGMNLHMSGDWEVYFDVTRGGITERAQVAVTLP
jgi:YtkA-like